MTTRAFVAVELPEDVLDTLATLQTDLGRRLSGVRWTRRDQLHLTLKFLGDLDDPALDTVRDGLAGVTVRPARLTLAAPGRFPPRGVPRVLWAGIDDPEGHLAALAAAADDVAGTAGVERERRAFHPHVTIGRVRDPHRCQGVDDALASAVPPPSPVPLQGFTLFASELHPEGARHTVLRRYGSG